MNDLNKFCFPFPFSILNRSDPTVTSAWFDAAFIMFPSKETRDTMTRDGRGTLESGMVHRKEIQGTYVLSVQNKFQGLARYLWYRFQHL